MSERARFVLVTDNIDFALADVFASRRTNAPAFVRITDDPMEVLALPHRCKVHPAIWTCTGRNRSGVELAWLERRRQGDLVFLTDEEMEKISAWRARRVGGTSLDVADNREAQTPPPSAVASYPLQQWT
ncbi:hypothetical protein [Shinella zoogloeoides]|uniref:hypothetical protein n=1 Tax=Shinella zoogloeoides TaxID=352475 RepID=UPI0028A846E8|nr:hypothetical protein [Shinella zoogloeoides]